MGFVKVFEATGADACENEHPCGLEMSRAIISNISFAFVSPLYRAKDNLWLIPRYSDVMPYLKEAMDKLREWDHPFVVLARAGIPWRME